MASASSVTPTGGQGDRPLGEQTNQQAPSHAEDRAQEQVPAESFSQSAAEEAPET